MFLCMRRRNSWGVPKIVPQDRIQQQTVEQTVDILVPQDVEELAEFFKTSSQDRVQLRFGGKIIETPGSLRCPSFRRKKGRVQHAVSAVEVEKSEIIGSRFVAEIAETPQLQVPDKMVDVPVCCARHTGASRGEDS